MASGPKSSAEYAGKWVERKKDGSVKPDGQSLDISAVGPCMVSATTQNTPHIRLSQLLRCVHAPAMMWHSALFINAAVVRLAVGLATRSVGAASASNP